jgi:N6-adenosine-specific RNA methylase IME4
MKQDVLIPPRAGLNLPGKLTRTSWQLPQEMSFEQWRMCGLALIEIGSAVAWWIGDWWAYGEHAYGERIAALRDGLFEGEYTYSTLKTYGWVSRSVEKSTRVDLLTHRHHLEIAALPHAEQKKWLARALKGDGDGKPWSAAKLRAEIRWQAARDATVAAELEASKLGKYVVLYADPPWQYTHPPMGGSNRSIENHYPTMTIEEMCALKISSIAHKDSMLFLWVTTPLLQQSFDILMAWGFSYRTGMVWVKDKIGMGYYVRQRHELLLIAKRGELPLPEPEARCDSVLEAPRLEHSAKPTEMYDRIDGLYPKVRKIELFARGEMKREGWKAWGNQ